MTDSVTRLEIIDGPDKPAMQFALAYPDKHEVHFRLANDAIDARLTRMEEMGQGFDFRVEGVVTTGTHKGRAFIGTYSVEGRTGTLQVGG